ncbi:hypothetical protein DENSPDRAFT_934727, partial [Dentipellis sp. KUC8613]
MSISSMSDTPHPTRSKIHLEVYQPLRSSLRAKLRLIIRLSLQAILGHPRVKMDWKNYWEEIVFKHKVQIHGWPSGIPFGKMD